MTRQLRKAEPWTAHTRMESAEASLPTEDLRSSWVGDREDNGVGDRLNHADRDVKCSSVEDAARRTELGQRLRCVACQQAASLNHPSCINSIIGTGWQGKRARGTEGIKVPRCEMESGQHVDSSFDCQR
jgi:hypothetical protein